jgi:hypothetical protein
LIFFQQNGAGTRLCRFDRRSQSRTTATNNDDVNEFDQTNPPFGWMI